MTTHCANCGQPLDESRSCPPCHAARSRRWYSENTTIASARRAILTKVTRSLSLEERETLHAAVVSAQRGKCACCDRATDLNLDWSIDQTSEKDGLPLFRAAVCRSCKIAINRVIHPSRFVLSAERLAMVNAYMMRAWRDPMTVLTRGVQVREDVFGQTITREVAERIAETDATIDFLRSIGVSQ